MAKYTMFLARGRGCRLLPPQSPRWGDYRRVLIKRIDQNPSVDHENSRSLHYEQVFILFHPPFAPLYKPYRPGRS
jgi:hypothetical protein